jgi:hypothetical protein
MNYAIELETQNSGYAFDIEFKHWDDADDINLENDPIGAWWTDEK